MKNNDFDKMFSNMNDETTEKIAEEYPTGDKKHRDRVYKEVERRVGEGFSGSGDEVRGVETYRPRPYLRFASAAAAVVIAAGAVGGGYFLMNKSSKNSDKLVPASEISESVEITDPVTIVEEPATEAVTEAVTVPMLLTKDELIEKINNRAYENYDRLSIEYTLSSGSGASVEHGIAIRDGITGNESLTQTWTHSADYFKEFDPEEYDIDELMKEENTCNEMFFYKDLFICIYSNGTDAPAEYSVTDRSDWILDDPTVFRNLYSENIAVDLDIYNIDDSTSSTVYLGRQCTEARIYGVEKELQERLKQKYDLGDPMTEPGASNEDLTRETIITVDNETGFILRAVTTIGDYTEEFEVDEILFNDDAELAPNGAYIKKKIEGLTPVSDKAAEFDLSALDEDAAGSEEIIETPTDEYSYKDSTADDTTSPEYEVNSKGQTYGGAGYTISKENIDLLPDLIGFGINGGIDKTEQTYLNTKEFIDTFVNCEAAFDMQEPLNNISDTAVSVDVNLYDEEGNFLRTFTFYTEPDNLK